jgi:hypothetical protein
MRLLCATTIVLVTITVQRVVVAQNVTAWTGFEVASVRRVADGQQSSPVLRITERGQLVGGATLKNLILLAYGAEPYERTARGLRRITLLRGDVRDFSPAA